MLGDVTIVEFREPADKQRRAIGRLDADARRFHGPHRYEIGDDTEHSTRRALKEPCEIGRLHHDPGIRGVIDERQPFRRFMLVFLGLARVVGSAFALLGALFSGILIGAFNGVFIALLGVPFLLVTLATLFLFQGLAYAVHGWVFFGRD